MNKDPAHWNRQEWMPKHSVVLAGHKTSISLEKFFWDELKRLARSRGMHIGELICEIEYSSPPRTKPRGLSSALRVYILNDAITRASDAARARDAAIESLKQLQSLLGGGQGDIAMKLAIAKQAGVIDA